MSAASLARPINGAALAVALMLIGAPSVIFALDMRAPNSIALGAGAIVCTAVGVFALLKGQGAFVAAPLDWPQLLACLALAFILLILGGETHLFRPTNDWYVRDAVLADLTKGDTLPLYRINGVDYLLRAPLGMYVVPALVGRAAGLFAAHVAMLAQNALVLAVLLYALLVLGRGWKTVAIVLGFAGAAGLVRLVAYVATSDLAKLLPGGDTIDSWTPLLQYTGSITQLFWVPNHALPGWFTAILLLLRARLEVDTATVGAALALMMFWSPLAIMPAIPGLIYFAVREPRETFANRRFWIALVAALACLPVAAYVTAASDTIPRPTIIGDPDFWPTYFAFLPVQLGSVGVVWYLRDRIPAEWRGLYWLNAVLLVFLPFVSFGEYNDGVMRGSIAALTIIAFVFGLTLQGWPPRRMAEVIGVALVLIAASSGGYEIYRALTARTYPVSACNLMEVGDASGRQTLLANYIAPVDATLRRLFTVDRKPLVDRSWKPPTTGPFPPESLALDTACWRAP